MFGQRVPVILQSEAPECGIACVAMIASYHGYRTDLSAMRLRLAPSMKGVTLAHISAIAHTMKLSARGVKVELEGLAQLKLPAILHWDMNHFVVLTKASSNKITVHDPARGKRVMALSEASRHFTGVAMELSPTQGFARTDEREKMSAWHLMGALRGLKGTLLQVALLSLVLEAFALAAPFFLQIAVDRVVVSRDRDLLSVLGIGFVLLALMMVSVMVVRAWLGVYLSTHVNLRLMDSLFNQLLKLPMAWFEKRHIGDIVSRFHSVDTVQRTLSVTFIETILDGLMVLLTLVVMAWYSLLLTGVVVVAVVLYGLVRWSLFGPQRRATDEKLVHEARAGTHFIETVRGMMAIKLGRREGERRSAYQNLLVEETNADVRVQTIGIAHKAATSLIFALENVAVIWLGALAVLANTLSVGMLFGFIMFKALLITRVNNLVDKFIEFRMLDLHAERIADIALAKPESAGEHAQALVVAPTAPFVIEGRQLAFSYGIEGAVFREQDFLVRPGETVAIVGPSGCGKTTLVKVLLGLLEHSEGTLTAAGRNLRDWDLSAYRGHIGAVMQDDYLFVGSIEDNISFFDPQHDAARVRQAAQVAMIHADIEAMPMQYNTIVGSLGVALSGGQKQRVLLARALYRAPKILFLDETFDQLDLAHEAKITTQLKALGMGVVIVSHRPDTVRTVDRIIHIGAAQIQPLSLIEASA
jgi:ATP-binding cassette, subfamily B, bacterial CvaB/MchF/RaxB